MSQSNIHKCSLAIVTMHWMAALLMAFAIYSGMFQMSSIPREIMEGVVANPASLSALWWHIVVSISAGVLIAGMLLARWAKPLPPKVYKNATAVDKLSRWFHYLLYVAVFVLTISGFMAFGMGGIKQIVVDFQEVTGPFSRPAIMIHSVFGNLILPILLFLHIMAALYHQFIVKNHVFRRMWF